MLGKKEIEKLAKEFDDEKGATESPYSSFIKGFNKAVAIFNKNLK